VKISGAEKITNNRTAKNNIFLPMNLFIIIPLFSDIYIL